MAEQSHIFEVEMPDGHILEIEAPAATEIGKIRERAKQWLQGNQPASPTLLDSRKAASKSEFDANQPESTIGTRLREARLGMLAPFDLRNVPSMAGDVGSALSDALTGKGTSKAQELAKALITAPVQPVKDWMSGIMAGDYDKAAGGSGGMLSQTAPAVAGVAEAGSAAVPMAKALSRDTAARLYESALKPGPRSNTLPEIKRMVSTGLQEGIPVSGKGVNKLNSLVDALNQEIKGTIDTGNNQGATVNKFKVASRLNDMAKILANQVNPESDLGTLSESGNEFLRNQPNEIPASTAQELKQGTYRQLNNRAYGELKSAGVEGQKTLARGLKEELAAQFPEIQGLNLRESDLLSLKDELQSAVNRQRNKEMFGIGTPVLGGAVGVATGSGPAAVGAGLARWAIDNPGIKSRLAIALARAGR